MATNDFLVFGGGAGANVLSQAAWFALTQRASGFASGLANSQQCNKAWRQSSILAAVVAQFISDRTGQDVLDDGTTATILANLKASAAAVNGDSSKTFSVAAGTSAQHAASLSQFVATLANNGYIKIPVVVAGVLRTVIIQWGQATVTGGGGQAVATYPIAWPTGLLGDVAFSGFGNIVVNGVTSTLSTRQFNLTQGSSGAAAANGTTCSYIAIGW